jgi:hypothetical protein
MGLVGWILFAEKVGSLKNLCNMGLVGWILLDRIIPQAHRIELKGKSRRKNLNQLP